MSVGSAPGKVLEVIPRILCMRGARVSSCLSVCVCPGVRCLPLASSGPPAGIFCRETGLLFGDLTVEPSFLGRLFALWVRRWLWMSAVLGQLLRRSFLREAAPRSQSDGWKKRRCRRPFASPVELPGRMDEPSKRYPYSAYFPGAPYQYFPPRRFPF